MNPGIKRLTEDWKENAYNAKLQTHNPHYLHKGRLFQDRSERWSSYAEGLTHLDQEDEERGRLFSGGYLYAYNAEPHTRLSDRNCEELPRRVIKLIAGQIDKFVTAT